MIKNEPELLNLDFNSKLCKFIVSMLIPIFFVEHFRIQVNLSSQLWKKSIFQLEFRINILNRIEFFFVIYLVIMLWNYLGNNRIEIILEKKSVENDLKPLTCLCGRTKVPHNVHTTNVTRFWDRTYIASAHEYPHRWQRYSKMTLILCVIFQIQN